jgi:hypothetical protein
MRGEDAQQQRCPTTKMPNNKDAQQQLHTLLELLGA